MEHISLPVIDISLKMIRVLFQQKCFTIYFYLNNFFVISTYRAHSLKEDSEEILKVRVNHR